MSYLVLARKYRPQTFEDIVAQEHVSRTLVNAIRNDRVASAYLFCGPRGTGKTTTARVLAKAINCDEGPTTTPCGKCTACREIEAAGSSSLDVFEIDAASNTGIDDIRALREQVNYQPTPGKKRIYIIDEVHRLSKQAFDALLKTLEEPPAHVMFIFATTEPMSVPDTILSRTQRFDFKRVSTEELTRHLKKISDAEGLTIGEGALRMLARKADGSVRDSLSLLDQIAAFVDDMVQEEDIIRALGLVDRKFLAEFISAVAARDTKAALAMARKVGHAGIDVKDFAQELLEHLRTLLVLAADPEASETLDFTDDELADFRSQAEHFSVGDIVRLMKMGGEIIANLKSGLDERLILEMTSVKMASMESTVSFEQILSHLAAGGLTGVAGSSDLFGTEKKKGDRLTLVKPPSTPTQAKPTSIEGRSLNLLQIQTGWDKFLTLLRNRDNMVASQLSMARLGHIKDNKLILIYGSSQAASKMLVERDDNSKLIAELLHEQYGTPVVVGFELEAEKTSSEPNGDAKARELAAKKLVDESPRLSKLKDLVDGEIIGVKKIE